MNNYIFKNKTKKNKRVFLYGKTITFLFWDPLYNSQTYVALWQVSLLTLACNVLP